MKILRLGNIVFKNKKHTELIKKYDKGCKHMYFGGQKKGKKNVFLYVSLFSLCSCGRIGPPQCRSYGDQCGRASFVIEVWHMLTLCK